jgi:hypothetical protein
MKILLLDIETAPNLVHVWGLWQQNVHISQIMDSSYVMCWAAKWLGEDEIFFDSVHQSKPKAMLKGIFKLLEEADAVIHYNGTRFDIPTLNKEFLLHGFLPPSTYKQIDLLLTARGRFRFPSHKLDFMMAPGRKWKTITRTTLLFLKKSTTFSVLGFATIPIWDYMMSKRKLPAPTVVVHT